MRLKAGLGLCMVWWACSPATEHASSSGSTPAAPCDVVQGAALAAPAVFIQRDDQANHPGVPAWFRVVDEHGGLGPRVDVPGGLQDPLLFFPRRHVLLLKMRDTLEAWDTQAGVRKDSRAVAGSYAVSPDGHHVLSLENDRLLLQHLGDDGLFTTDVVERPLARPIMMPDQWVDSHTCVIREWDPATNLTTSVVKLDVATGDWQTLWTQDGVEQVDRLFFHAASGTLLLSGSPSYATRAVSVPDGATVATQPGSFFRLNGGSADDDVGIWLPSGEVALWAPWQQVTPVPIPGTAGALVTGLSRDHVWLMPYPTPDGPFVVTQRDLSGQVTGSWEIPLAEATQPILDMHPTVFVTLGYLHPTGVARVGVSVMISDFGFSLGDMVLGNHGCVFQAHAAQFIYTRGDAFMAAPSLTGGDHASLMTFLPDGKVGHVADFNAGELGMMLSPEPE